MPPVKRSHCVLLSQMGIQSMPKASMNNRWLKAGQGMSECIPAHFQGLIPFSGDSNDEEIPPTHSASALPSWILVKPLKLQSQLNSSATRPPTHEDSYFQCNHVPAERLFFLLVTISHTPAGNS